MNPAEYDAWYHTPRGAWVSDAEFLLLRKLLKPGYGDNLLDVGCGTGHFSRRLARSGMHVTGVDPDIAMLDFAKSQDAGIVYQHGMAENLPFDDASFDHVTAITSLCFVSQPVLAIQEMWRVCRKSVIVGLLNRRSLLYRRKVHRDSYRGARWDKRAEVEAWLSLLDPAPRATLFASCIFLPGYQRYQRYLERLIPHTLPYGAFLAVKITKPEPGPGQAIPTTES